MNFSSFTGRNSNELSSIINSYGNFITQIENDQNKTEEQEYVFTQKQSIEKNFDITSLRLKNTNTFPFNLFIIEEIQNFLDASILKPIDHRGLNISFNEFIHHFKFIELTETVFWSFLLIKFPIIAGDEESHSVLLKEFRKKISSIYVSFISILPQNQKENLLNLIIFSMGYIILLIFCKHFPIEKAGITNRFILDIFHIILFEINGVFVSDFYVQNLIEKMFSAKFLSFYKDYGSIKKIEIISRKPKYFLGNQINFPETLHTNRNLMSFSHELSAVLYKNIDFSHKKIGTQKLDPNKNTPKNEKIIYPHSQMNNTDAKSLNPNDNSSMNSLKNTEANYIGKMKFDCCQISPTISNVLENTKMSLPHLKKKVINHPLDKSMEVSITKSINNNNNTSTQYNNNSSNKKKIVKNSILGPYNYTSNDLTDEYKSDSKYLKDLYELKFVLDQNKQNTFQLPSSQKLLENHHKLRTKTENEYLLDKGYSAFSIEGFRKIKEKEQKQKQNETEQPRKKEIIEENNTSSSPNKTEPIINAPNTSLLSPKVGSKTFMKRFSQLNPKLSIVNLSEKTPKAEEKAAEIPRKLKALVIERNMEYEEALEIENKKQEIDDLGNWMVNENTNKWISYVDHRKKYKDEHCKLIRGNVDANINNLVNNIIQKKEAATKAIVRIKYSKIRRKNLK